MARIYAVAAVVGCVLSVGCASYGRRVDEAAIASVKVCTTKKAEALQRLGEPYKTGSVGDLQLLTYEYGGMSGTDRLQVALDSNGVVVDMAHNADYGYTAQNRCKK